MRLQRDHLVFLGQNRFVDVSESDGDVCPLAKSIRQVQHVATGTCGGEKVLSWGSVEDGEALGATHAEPLTNVLSAV